MPYPNFCAFTLSCIVVATLSACNPVSIHHQNASSANNTENILNLLDPDVHTEEQAVLKAEEALAEGKADSALFYFVKALQYNPKNIKVLERIAEIHSHSNHPELALKVYKDILAIDSQHTIANEYVGLNLLENGRNNKAEEHLNIAVGKNNTSWKAHNGLGIIADLQHDTEKAITHYEEALAIEPSSPMLLNNLGYSYYLAGDVNKAKVLFNQALNFDNKYKRAIQNLALIYIKSGNFTHAAALFNRIMPVHDTFNNIGYLAMLNGQYDAADEYLNRAIDECPVYFSKAQENLKTLSEIKAASRPYQISADETREINISPEIQPSTAEKPVSAVLESRPVVPKIVSLYNPAPEKINSAVNKQENKYKVFNAQQALKEEPFKKKHTESLQPIKSNIAVASKNSDDRPKTPDTLTSLLTLEPIKKNDVFVTNIVMDK